MNSMTGYARAQGRQNGCSWTWEMKSVNGKGLDVRCRLASGFECLEHIVRERVKGGVRRGNLTASLTVDWSQSQGGVRVNQEALNQFLALMEEINSKLPEMAPPSADGLLGLRGVIEAAEGGQSEEECRALDAALLDSLDQALESLNSMRAGEGGRLAGVLAGQLDGIAGLIGSIKDLASLQPQAIKERLKVQVEELLEAVPALPEERLAQEAAVLMIKADVREELDRLEAHVEAARELLGGDMAAREAAKEAIGRKFDFLCQEFGREANTLCSKSPDVEMTRLGLDLKSVIDQLREQVQNIE